MSHSASDSKAALLLQGVWPLAVAPPPVDRGELIQALSVQAVELKARIEALFPGVEILGTCALAPLFLLRCREEQSTRIREELGKWPRIVRVEETLCETEEARFWPLENPAPRPAEPCIAGFADLSEPIVAQAMLEERGGRCEGVSRRAQQSTESTPTHADSVLASFLETLGPGRTPRCLFERLDQGAGPFAWLAAIDRLFCRGARVVNLSYGRLEIERASGWNGLDWGTELLCLGSGGTVVAAAGQVNVGLSHGDALYLPASAPEILAAADELRAQATRPRHQAAKLLLASSSDPYRGRSGSSYSAPRISALAVQAYDDLPRDVRSRESVLALLLASARPSNSGVMSAGFPDPERMSRIAASGSCRHGRGDERVVLPATLGTPTRIALSWQGCEPDPSLQFSAAVEQQVLRRSERWIVLDAALRNEQIELSGLSGTWSLAFRSLSPEEFQISKNGMKRVRQVS